MTDELHSPNPDTRDLTELARTILGAEEKDQAPAPRRAARPRQVDWNKVRSLRVSGGIVQALFALWVGFGVWALVVSRSQRSLLHRIADDPAGVSWSEVVADQQRVDTLNAVFIGLLAATGVAFIVWFATANANLDALGVRRRFGTGWAIGGWFVPFLCWWRPKQIADDLWGSVDAARPSDGMGAPPKSMLVGCWWAAWIAAFVVGMFANAGDEMTVDDVLRANGWFMARAVVFIVAAVLACFVVRAISRAQRPDEPIPATS